MKKLLNKKGFTLVELIVVIAILGIMIAIVVPMLSTADARKNEVREYARSFYSNVQELMIDEKLAGNDLPGTFTLICAQVDENQTTFDGVKISIAYTDGAPAAGVLSFENLEELVDDNEGNDKLELTTGSYTRFAEFGNSLRRLLLGNERTGWYYAVVDSKYRVVSTYFVEGEGSDFSAVGGETFSDNYVLIDQYAGAWPEELADSGTQMFTLPS